MKNPTVCTDFDHLTCIHATARRLVAIIAKTRGTEYDGTGLHVAFIGIRADHWRQLVLTVAHADAMFTCGMFSVTRQNGDIVFVVPVQDLAHPKVLDDDDLELLDELFKSAPAMLC